MYLLDNLEKKTVQDKVKEAVSKNSRAKTDGFRSYNGLDEYLDKHEKVIASGKEAAKKLPWVHICISNLKRWLLGIHHAVSFQYIQNYLDEFCFRINRRFFLDNNYFDRIIHNTSLHQW